MAKKTTRDYITILQENYFKGEYHPQTKFINELNLLHSTRILGIGGEQALNDANSKVEVGISDFNGTLTPTDAKGLMRAMTIRYGTSSKDVSPALVKYSEIETDFPAWLLNSEIIIKTGSVEALRTRVNDLVLGSKPDKVASEWAKEFEKTVKISGGQDLQIYLSTPKGAEQDKGTAESPKFDYVAVNLYGIKFGDRKAN